MRSLRTALACSVVLLSGLPVLAVEPEAAAARLKALIEAQGATFTWSSVSGDSANATIEGATVTREGEGGPIELGTIAMNGIAEASDGSLTVETLTAPGYSHTSGDATYEASGLEIGKLILPADPAQADAWMRFATMHMDAVKATKRDRELFSASDITYELEMPHADGESVSVTATAQRFSAEEHEGRSLIANDIADIMGIRSYAGSATAHAKWNPVQGDVELESAELLLDGSGRLSLSFSGSGYTSELLKSGQALDMNFGGGQSMEALMARGMAMFSVVSQVTFNGASVRFEPAPGVAPDPAAAKEARDRIARDIAPFGKQFAAQTLAEIDEYIADPRSLEVRAVPPAPVNAATLTLGLMAAPKGLPQQLGLAIKANE